VTERRRYGPKSLELLNRSPFDSGRSDSGGTVYVWRIRMANKNASEACRDCLIIYVTESAELYRRMEGAWYGIVLGAHSAT
jgi:hypothetical protein